MHANPLLSFLGVVVDTGQRHCIPPSLPFSLVLFVAMGTDALWQWHWWDEAGVLFMSSAQLLKSHIVCENQSWRLTGSNSCCLGIIVHNWGWPEWMPWGRGVQTTTRRTGETHLPSPLSADCPYPQRQMKQRFSICQPIRITLKLLFFFINF